MSVMCSDISRLRQRVSPGRRAGRVMGYRLNHAWTAINQYDRTQYNAAPAARVDGWQRPGTVSRAATVAGAMLAFRP